MNSTNNSALWVVMLRNNSNIFSVNEPHDSKVLLPLVNAMIMPISGLRALLQTISLVILLKCKKIALPTKMLSANFLVSEIPFSVQIIVSNACMLTIGNRYFETIFYTRLIVTGILAMISWASIVGLTLERLLALTMTMEHKTLVTKKSTAVFICLLWLINALLPSVASFVLVALRPCAEIDVETCDFFTAFLPIRISVGIVSISYIIFIVASKKNVETTQRITKIVLVYIIFHAPVSICILVLALKGKKSI